MRRHFKRLLVPAIAAVLAIGIASSNLIGQGGDDPPPLTKWEIHDPYEGKPFRFTSNVSTDGDAEVDLAAFIVKVTSPGNAHLEYNSKSGSSTANFDWSCTVTPPVLTKVWPLGPAVVRLFVGGDQEDSVKVTFKKL